MQAILNSGRRNKIIKHYIYTLWARLGRVSGYLAHHFDSKNPPILILSLPRSGSSWVGTILGSASNAMYLREPITQNWLAARQNKVVTDIDPHHPPKMYKLFADDAFAGIPKFNRVVVKTPEQWRLLERSQRRLVIKEVNPRACEFFLVNYQPKVIFLMRHPMAVGLSYRKLGWLDTDTDFWKGVAEMQGSALSNAWNVLQSHSDYKVVSYEELCAEPTKLYQEIFKFTELVWNKNIENLIDSHNTKGNLDDPYDTRRNSKEMAQSWRENVTKQEIDDVKSVFDRYKLPRYQLQTEW